MINICQQKPKLTISNLKKSFFKDLNKLCLTETYKKYKVQANRNNFSSYMIAGEKKDWIS